MMLTKNSGAYLADNLMSLFKPNDSSALNMFWCWLKSIGDKIIKYLGALRAFRYSQKSIRSKAIHCRDQT